ncbi:MAG: Mur ligase family protein [Alphaproteobacteria bacterium]
MIDLKKKFLIYGFGISGKSISKYLKRKKVYYKIYDDYLDLSKNKDSIDLGYFKKNIKLFDYFVVSPSIKIDKKHILFAHQKKILIDLDFLSLELNNQIVIGVTGTEGKSTICFYLFQYLSNFYNPIIIGNYGNTILDKHNIQNLLNKTKVIIVELSSYQLDKIKYLRLNHAVITNIYPDHLRYHGSFLNYVKSKFKIQSLLVDNGYLHISNLDKRKYSKLIKINPNNINSISNLNIKNKIFGFDINLHNEYISQRILLTSGLKYNQNIKLKNLPFRYELIDNKSDFMIINDSKSTNLENSLLKINQINLNQKIIILGGIPKKSINKKNKVKNSLVLIFGPNRFSIVEKLDFNNSKFFTFIDLERLFKFLNVVIHQLKIDIILFSPGGESFDQFKNYSHRGLIFNKYIKKFKI